MNLYKFFWDCGRMGEVEGIFVAEQKDIDRAIGKQVYFGEILGKHSEIYGELELSDIVMFAVPEDVVEILFNAVGSTDISGYNPLNYLPEEDEEIEAYDD